MSTFTDLLRLFIARHPRGQLGIAERTEEIAQQLRDQGDKTATGVQQNSINYMRDHESIPKLPTLRMLALALDVPLGTLIECFYPLGQYKVQDEQRTRLQAQIGAGTETFVELVEKLTNLTPEQQEDMAAYADHILARKQRR